MLGDINKTKSEPTMGMQYTSTLSTWQVIVFSIYRNPVS
jgi:hypothetical protein